jgi:hypothetical protein
MDESLSFLKAAFYEGLELPERPRSQKVSDALEVVVVEVRLQLKPAPKVIPVEGQLVVRHQLAFVPPATKLANGIANRHAQVGIAGPIWMLSQPDLELDLAFVAGANDTQGDPVAGLAPGNGVAERLSAANWLAVEGHDQSALR